MTDSPARLRRSRLTLLLVFLLFLVPTVAAWMLVRFDWRPGGTVNHGQLVQPVEPMAQLPITDADGQPVGEAPFQRHWSVLVSTTGACGELCRQTLDLVGHAHVALNKDMDRLRTGLVLPPQVPAPALPKQVLLLRAPPAQLKAWAAGAAATEQGVAVHIVDYRGFRMMVYPTPLDASGMLKDLRRLLKLSTAEIERRQGLSEEAR